MMTSDSEESDYEDAHLHHDNQAGEFNVEAGSPSHPVILPVRGGGTNPSPPAPIEEEPEQVALQPPHELIEIEHQVVDLVDSDSDDVDHHYMDDLINDEIHGGVGGHRLVLDESSESDRAGTSDGNDAQDPGDMDEDAPEFDQELPIRHAYLGEGMEELQGRVVLEEDATPEIPLIAMGQHLIPGQTLPLQVYHAVFQNAIRRCVLGDRLFGIVHNDMTSAQNGNVIYIGALGTLAEIFEYQEESEPNGEIGVLSSTFAVKTKGRQRFNVLEVRRQADGNLMGRIRIRPEIRLEPFVMNLLSQTSSRIFPVTLSLPPNEVTEEEQQEAIPTPDSPATVSRSSRFARFSFSRRDSVSSVASTSTVAPAIREQMDQDLLQLRTKIQSNRKRLKYYSPLTPHPYWVYEQYDETVLVERVHTLLKSELKGVAKSKGRIPMDATDLSFWLAQNLLIDDNHRTKILKMDCSIQRLRYYLQLLGRTQKIISCKHCETHIADHSQIFSMSIEGPQGTYVNPHGFVHETLTVYKARELVTRGGPSTEASWFPGYSWTIVECKRCNSHIGWKFQAVTRLKPLRFWGLARRSVISKYNFGSDPDLLEAENMESSQSQRAEPEPPNSAGEGYSTVALF